MRCGLRNHDCPENFAMRINFRFNPLHIALGVAMAMMPIHDVSAAGKVQTSGLRASQRYEGFIVKYRNGSAERTNAAVRDRDLGNAASGLVGANVQGLALRHQRRLGIGADLVRASRALSSTEAEALMRRIATNPNVEYVEPDVWMTHSLIPNDPGFGPQWGFHDADAGIRADRAWDLADGTGIVVAVLDTGSTNHSDLNANLVPGYDFISDPFVSRDGNGRDRNPADEGDWLEGNECPGGNNLPDDSSWHGTHVAGTVAALTNNAMGVAGTAWGARVMHVRVLGRCGGSLSDIVDAIAWASGGAVPGVTTLPPANVADVINMSFGANSACGPTFQNAINEAVSRGTTLVASAGNDAIDAASQQPAGCANVITVAAVDRDSARAWFSNFGSKIDVSAPGDFILSTSNAGLTTPTTEGYDVKDGTSMAAPHVSGVIALTQARRLASGLTMYTPEQVERLLKNTAYPLSGTCTGGCGAGIVDAFAAVDAPGPDIGKKLFEQTDASGKITIAVFERYSPTAASHNTDFAVEVPRDYVVIGGGGEGKENPTGNLLTASYPRADMGAWLVSTKDHRQSDPVQVRAWAIGLKIAGLTPAQLRSELTVRTATSGFTGHPDVIANLPAGYVLLGGGLKVNWSGAGNLATRSSPTADARGWRAISKDHLIASPATTQAFAIGIRSSIAGVGNLSAAIVESTSPFAPHPVNTTATRAGYALTGCGAFANWSGAGNLLWRIRPSSPGAGLTACAVASKDHLVSSPATITGYSIGLKAD
jgi:serine protease